LENVDGNGRVILKDIFKKWDGTWTGLIWFSLETGGGLLCKQRGTFGLHKMEGIS
jgi:hypothetical protein